MTTDMILTILLKKRSNETYELTISKLNEKKMKLKIKLTSNGNVYNLCR